MSEPGESPVLFRRVRSRLPRRELAGFARTLARRVAGRPFCCLVSDDRELAGLNRRFLERDYAADVLSFPGTGEIAISAERARAQARVLGHSVADEIRILMLHGALHLAGMDHESDSGRMARAESRWRRKLGLPGGLIERARR
ncbi:MAG: rRNA maturation RNase YbeY [Bryobacteraceae bacterium]